jgi:hypothetical protein
LILDDGLSQLRHGIAVIAALPPAVEILEGGGHPAVG